MCFIHYDILIIILKLWISRGRGCPGPPPPSPYPIASRMRTLYDFACRCRDFKLWKQNENITLFLFCEKRFNDRCCYLRKPGVYDPFCSSTRRCRGCIGVEWIVNPWLAKMRYSWSGNGHRDPAQYYMRCTLTACRHP